MANYEKVLTGVATHPSHVILILSNENDMVGITLMGTVNTQSDHEFAHVWQLQQCSLKQH